MTDIHNGLTQREAEEKAKRGESNGDINVPTKSIGQIVRSNTLTFFNILNVILAAAVFLVGSYKNALFMGVIVCNIAIGIFQEIRAKRTIDRLSLISAPKARVIRDGEEKTIPVSEIVIGDITILEAGMQVCADSVVRSGECEVNESLITGESDPVSKVEGDTVMSGSFIICGKICAEAEKVGKESFSGKITGGAKYIKKNSSEMLRSINAIIKGISVCIVPLAVLLMLKSLFITGEGMQNAVVSTVAAIIGMIPEGLVLLASMVLAVSVIRLSKHNTLVQELYCIETLARVDVLCLDKTGTITEGTMQVDAVETLDGECDVDRVMNAMMTALADGNPTFAAMKERWNEKSDIAAAKTLPFSSAKKWSGAELGGEIKGTYVVGAAEFILGSEFDKICERTERYSESGQRVLLLAKSDSPFEGKNLPSGEMKPLALIIISDKIREEAPATLAFFAEQGVNLKIISGDNPVTVASIAKRAGLRNADRYVDAATITDIDEAAEKYSVFGRVTPQQKLALVKALRAKGHTVGMTGDGVNDVLALKEADCSVAMQSGSDAARSVSNLVLLDSNFASMPKVVAEGRRSINNIERSATLFLTKTVYAFFLAVIFVFVQKPYPFIPIQMTLISALTIGAPSFLLALQQNTNLVRGKFIENVMKLALPQGLAAVLALVLMTVSAQIFGFTPEQTRTAATIILGTTSFAVMFRLCRPFNKRKAAMFTVLLAAFWTGLLAFGGLFAVTGFSVSLIIVSAVLSLIGILCVALFPKFTAPLVSKSAKLGERLLEKRRKPFGKTK